MPLHGIFPICTTPFSSANQVDFPALRRVVEHIVTEGAHGLVYPAIASEFQTLDANERRSAVETVCDALNRRIDLVVGVSSPDAAYSAQLAQEAEALGAAAVMLMPPPVLVGDETGLIRLFVEVTGKCKLPVILQNAPPPLGPALSTTMLLKLIAQIPAITYVKEETLPCGHRISRLLKDAPARFLGVFGGAGGRFALDELARGAAGYMPACEYTRIHVEIFNRFRAGNHQRARKLFNDLMPLLMFESIFRTGATKEILFRMGMISSPKFRDDNPALDEYDLRELGIIVDELGKAVPAAPPAGGDTV